MRKLTQEQVEQREIENRLARACRDLIRHIDIDGAYRTPKGNLTRTVRNKMKKVMIHASDLQSHIDI